MNSPVHVQKIQVLALQDFMHDVGLHKTDRVAMLGGFRIQITNQAKVIEWTNVIHDVEIPASGKQIVEAAPEPISPELR